MDRVHGLAGVTSAACVMVVPFGGWRGGTDIVPPNLCRLIATSCRRSISKRIGLYGVMAFTVAQRTREIGVRVALGAVSGDILGGVMAEALVLVGVGLAAGSVAAAGLARLVANLLFGISATDPMTYAASAIVLVAVGTGAAYLPARRAARVAPMSALRSE